MNDILNLAVKIIGAVLLLLIVLSCLPILLLVLLVLAVTGNVGMAKNVIWTRTSFGHPRESGETGDHASPEANDDGEEDTIEAEVLNAETIVDGAEKTNAAGHSKNTFLE